MGWAQMVQGGINAGSELIKGRQEANRLRDQAALEQREIDLANQNMEIAGRASSAREEQMRRNIRQSLGAQRAAIAQSGTGFGGSNSAIIAQSTANAELDALNLRYQGQLERAGFQNEITMRTYNKAVLRKQAKVAMRMRWHNAAAAFFGASGAGLSQGGGAMPSTGGGMYGQGGSSFGLSSSFGVSGTASNPYGSLSQYSQFKGFGAGGLSAFGG